MSDDDEKPEGDVAKDAVAEKQPFVEKFKAFVNEYGTIALVTWFAIFFSTWGAFAALISTGLDLGGWLSDGEGSGWLYNLVKDWGPIGLAYIPTQIVKPIRAAATFAVTPVVHKVMYGRLGVEPESEPESESESED